MLTIIRLVVLLSVALPSTTAAQTLAQSDPLAARLAYFSPQQAFVQSADGKAAQARLSALQADRAKEISARNVQLKGLQESLQQSAGVLGETARRQRELEIEKFQIDVQRFVEDAQAEFLGVQRDLENAFFEKLHTALDSVAKERRLLFVFNADAGVLAWADPSLDITPDVVRRVDRP